MTLYSYKGLQENKIVGGTFEAPTTKDFFRKIENEKIHLVWFYPKFFIRLKKLSYQDSLTLCTHLEYLFKAHFSLQTALHFLAQHSSRNLYKVTLSLLKKTEGGFSLSEAMESEKSSFDSVFIRLLKVGESNGNLGDSFSHIRIYLLWKHKFQKTLTQSLRYPFILFLFLIILLVTLTSFLIPSLRSFLTSTGIDQSLATRSLLYITDLSTAYGSFFLTNLLFISITFFLLTKIKKINFFLHQILIKCPLLGPFLIKLWIIKISTSLSLLLKSDIFLIDALSIVRKQTDNLYLKLLLEKTHSALTKGQNLSKAFQSINILPPLAQHFIKAGECSNNLADSFLAMRDYYNEDVQYQIEFLKDFLPTVCLLFVGGFLIWIVLAIFYPLYSLSGM